MYDIFLCTLLHLSNVTIYFPNTNIDACLFPGVSHGIRSNESGRNANGEGENLAYLYESPPESSGDFDPTENEFTMPTENSENYISSSQLACGREKIESILGVPYAIHCSRTCKLYYEDRIRHPSVGDSDCFCDDACLLYGDCCLDYYFYFQNKPPASTSPGTVRLGIIQNGQNISTVAADEDSSGFSTSYQCTTDDHVVVNELMDAFVITSRMPHSWTNNWSCVTIKDILEQVKPLYMVKRCPEGINTANAAECENVKDNWPYDLVVERGKSMPRIFQNQFCAFCHGIALPTENTTIIKPSYNCGTKTSTATLILRLRGELAFLEFARKECTLTYDFTTQDDDLHHLSCQRELRTSYNYVDSCPDDYESTLGLTDSELLKNMCHRYASTVVHHQSLVVYKNPHCALCNGIPVVELSLDCRTINHAQGAEEIGEKTGVPKFPSFTILLDTSNDNKAVIQSMQTTCPPDSYFDTSTETCIESSCELGHIMINTTCLKFNVSSSNFHQKSEDSTYKLFGVYMVDERLIDQKKERISETKYAIDMLFESDDNISISLQDGDDCKVMKSMATRGFVELTVENQYCTILEVTTSQQNVILALITSLSEIVKLSIKDNEEETILYWFNFDVNEYLPCVAGSNGRIRRASLIDEKGIEKLYIKPSGARVSLENSLTLFTVTIGSDSLLSINLTNTLICEPQIFSCDRFSLPENEYYEEEDRLIANGYEPIVAGNYALLPDNKVLVCFDALVEYTSLSSIVQGLLTLIGLILSMLGLAFTLITYSLFSTLRTMPGKGIMNLAASLLLAQLLFELSPVVTKLDTLCYMFAVCQHYAWLVSFLWMTVLAYDISQTFAKMAASVSMNHSSRMRLFLAATWGTALLLVVTCIATDKLTNFGYIDSSTCWIFSGNPIVYSFATPLAAVMFVNFILFMRTTVSLGRAMKISKKVKSTARERSRFLLYIKLASLMGFTWLFGLVAAYANVQIISYLFVVTNSLQGVFICVSFTMTSRVRSMYKTLVGITTAKDSSSSSQNTTKSQVISSDRTEN